MAREHWGTEELVQYLDSIKEDTSWQDDEDCLLTKAANEELKKPWWLRSGGFMISCPCKRCNPYRC